MEHYIMQIICAALGAVAFGIVFNVKNKHMLPIFIGGAAVWFIYLLVFGYSQSIFIASNISTIIIAFYAEIMARVRKTPVTVILFPCLIPLAPGSSLYYSVSYGIARNEALMRRNMIDTFMTAIGVAMGVLMVSSVMHVLKKLPKKR